MNLRIGRPLALLSFLLTLPALASARRVARVLAQRDGKTLPAAIAKSHIIRADVGNGMHIALNWFRIDASGSYWHNGGTGGFSSYALFNPEKDLR